MTTEDALKELAIIGFGSFGKLAAKHLSAKFDVVVADVQDKSDEAKAFGVRFVPINEAAKKRVVILAVPVDKLKSILQDIRKDVTNGALILDVCSVKMLPVKLMTEILPADVEIIGTHPLFGPQSAHTGLQGHKIALCPVRTSRMDHVISFLSSLGLKTIITTAIEHDKQMAKTQALSHFIGKALINLGIQKEDISVPSFDKLLELTALLKNDSDELLKTILSDNPFAGQTIIEFSDQLESELKRFSILKPIVVETRK